MPVSILRKKSKYFVDDYKPKVHIPISKKAFEKLKADVIKEEQELIEQERIESGREMLKEFDS